MLSLEVSFEQSTAQTVPQEMYVNTGLERFYLKHISSPPRPLLFEGTLIFTMLLP